MAVTYDVEAAAARLIWPPVQWMVEKRGKKEVWLGNNNNSAIIITHVVEGV